MASYLAGNAEASVLFPNIAQSLYNTPKYAKCSKSIGAGQALPQLQYCAELATKEAYCMLYRATTHVQNDPAAQAAAAGCSNFFQAAIETQHLVCDYIRDAVAIQQQPVSADPVDGPKGAFADVAMQANCGEMVYKYYEQAALKQQGSFLAAAKAYDSTLGKLAEEGKKNLHAELVCRKAGAGNKPPGIYLIGLTAQSKYEIEENTKTVNEVLEKFKGHLTTQIKTAGDYQSKLALRESSMKGITQSDGRAPVKLTEDTSPVRTTAVSAGVVGAMAAPGYILGGATAAVMAKALLPLNALKALATGYISNGKVAQADMIVAVANIGIAIVGAAIGATTLPMIAAAIGVRAVVEYVKQGWIQYENEVILAYEKFYNTNKQKFANASSAQIAAAYASERDQMAYCSQCNVVETYANCPGARGSVHGFNPDYINNSEGFQNPWIKASPTPLIKAYGSTKAVVGRLPNISPTNRLP